MFEEFEEKGYWWLASDPDKEVPGILRYSPKDGISLELFGSFSGDLMRRRDMIVIQGIANN